MRSAETAYFFYHVGSRGVESIDCAEGLGQRRQRQRHRWRDRPDVGATNPGHAWLTGEPVAKVLDLSGGTVSNTTGVAANFQIVYVGTAPITLQGGSNSYGVVYAPNAAINTSGGAAWYGAVVSKTFTDSGGAPVHFDAALLNSLLQVGSFSPINFSWSKF